MPKKINWDAIRDAFISSERDLTYSDVASMFGVSRQAVELKASPKAENWQVLREAFRLTNAPASIVEAHVVKPDQSQPSSIVAHHLDPHALEESSSPTKERHLQRQDINNILVDAITQSSNALEDLEPRSFERTATVLISLLKVYTELNPPTPEEWALVAVNLNLSPETMLETLRKACE
jgi:hypothetical protein